MTTKTQYYARKSASGDPYGEVTIASCNLPRAELRGNKDWRPTRIKRIVVRLTAKGLAERLGCSLHTVYAWMSGYKNPSGRFVPELEKIETELGLSDGPSSQPVS